MRFLVIISTILGVVGLGKASAIPQELVARNTTAAQGYDPRCNSVLLVQANIDACISFLNDRAGQQCWTKGPNGNGQFCSSGSTYVSGVSWPDENHVMGIGCDLVAYRVQQLLWLCGMQGGSMGIIGGPTNVDMIIHVNDQWVG
ncbi:hypothetical protein BT63DRAFT_119026 [Microthyrium microscopicum]|uniref:Ecp2 effector protein domain-containing protein n=1 Tax=Microthyrium microscopicum TaxID=703497 RepID=A0A6A6TWB3_9PEZI|nr:hypothetical protein BT63DRAFT_119026 [Microthyrium microscopicum]